MGHNHLLVLPSSRKWRNVVDELTGGVSDASVISSTAIAAERELQDAARDPVFVEAVRLLLMVPFAARSDDFGASLRVAGLQVPQRPDLLDVIVAIGERLDEAARQSRNRSDIGEVAGRALCATLTEAVEARVPGLFGVTSMDIQLAIRQMSGRQGIAEICRSFFGSLLSKTLASWLDRKLSTLVGPGRRFADAGERGAFDVALTQYASEATRIIQEFAPGWYGKRLHEDGRITGNQAAVFGHVAFKKICEELRRKRDDDG